MKTALLKVACHASRMGVVGALALANYALGAGVQDRLADEIARVAEGLAGELNGLAQSVDGRPLIVAVRPARMLLDNIKVHCTPLSDDLQDILQRALEDRRTISHFTFEVRAVTPSEVADVEINTEWHHDVQDGVSLMKVVVDVVRVTTTGDTIIGGSDARWSVNEDRLSERRRGCLMKWKPEMREVRVADDQSVFVFEEPSTTSIELRKYETGEVVVVAGDAEPLNDSGASWQVVKVRERTYGFAQIRSFKPFTVSTVPSGATVLLLDHSETYYAGMLLPPGRYRVRAILEGYVTKTEVVVHGTVPTEHRLVLQPAVGSSFRDCDDCPTMVVVPPGSFMMGSSPKEHGRANDETPAHEVTIERPFALAVFEVAFEEWDACVRDNGCERHMPKDEARGDGRYPVVNVSWDDAQAYATWLSKRTGLQYRLPSESEWEYAARAGTGTSRYWGENESGQCRHANGADARMDPSWEKAGCDDGHAKTAPAGSYKKNRWGLHDMLGNVWEWVADCWNDSYTGAPSDGSAWLVGNCQRRVLRGGSWYSSPSFLRAANRNWNTSGERQHINGFRVARTLAP